MTDTPTVCAVCGTIVADIINAVTGKVVGYQHGPSITDDHPVVPVPAGSVPTDIKCDFCAVSHATWSLPVEDYVFQVSASYDGPRHRNTGNWAACDPCAALIKAGNWRKLCKRSQLQHAARGMFVPRSVYREIYTELRPHIIGEIRPLVLPEGEKK